MQNPVSLLEELMETKINEIANGIYRLSTFIPEIAPPAGFTFNQFLVLGDEPLLFHTGLRRMFPLIRTALSRILPPEHLRWISFGHYEADECGAMNEWLAVASQAKVVQGQTGCLVSLNDVADRTPQVLHDGEVIDLGKGKRVRYIDTPHIPHGWDAGVLYEETSRTLLCGDLFTQLGDGPALTESDVVGPAIAAEDTVQYSSLNPGIWARRSVDSQSSHRAHWRSCTAPHFPATARVHSAPWLTTTTSAFFGHALIMRSPEQKR
jgi:flavorubredoxin